ncbi:MAG: class I SAM-dependent methyltransferase [Bacteroidetes bacterium]|nr:class I SAM-dependent methyltransferase [Bacteroidota bacterium]
MDNPWKHIIEEDYVGHMSSPAVLQRPLLNRLLRDELTVTQPASVLIIGSSTGNGVEHIDPQRTRRVECIDINPTFIRSLRERFPDPPFQLTVHCMDVMEFDFRPSSYDLVHAALLFEYIGWQTILPHIVRSLTPGGVLSVVIQLPSATAPAVTPTPYTRLRALESVFHFVEPDRLIEQATGQSLILDKHSTEPLPSGKAFEVFRFVKQSGPVEDHR